MEIFKRVLNWFNERKQIHTQRCQPDPQLMIRHMLNKLSDDLGGRDDCAMDLGEYDLPEVEQALIQVVTDHSEDEMIVDSAIESLIEIWNRQERSVPDELLSKMHPVAIEYFSYGDT